MTECKVKSVKNREKKYKRRRRPASNEARGRTGKRRGRERLASVFLEITIPKEGIHGDPELVLWTFHKEGARGSLATTTFRKSARLSILKKVMEIQEIHTSESRKGRIRFIKQLTESDDWRDRIGAAKKLYEARKLDRKKVLDQIKGALAEPLDFDDFDDIIKRLSLKG